jgi:hypothetical protein
VLLLVGLATGIGGTLYIQERHLPPRLSAGESANLRDSLSKAEAERTSLRDQLADTETKLAASLAEGKRLADEGAARQQTVAALRDDVDFLLGALPPDPRGGAVEIRAARFRNARNALDYEIALVAGKGRMTGAVVELVVTADATKANPALVTLAPIALPAAGTAVLRGGAALPDGFAPNQCAIRVLDRPGGQLLGMRLINVR